MDFGIRIMGGSAWRLAKEISERAWGGSGSPLRGVKAIFAENE